jgi:hypothetical protein
MGSYCYRAAVVSFVRQVEIDRPPDFYSIVDCDCDDATVQEVARLVRDLYVAPAELADVLTQASVGLGAVLDETTLTMTIDRVQQAVIPAPGVARIPHLDTARNELAEVLSLVALPALWETAIPAPRIRDKEIGGQPTRGLDILGYDAEPTLTLVLAEVKASADLASPPAVVDSGATSLRGQLSAHLSDTDRLVAEISWAIKHASRDEKVTLGKLLLLQARGSLPVRIVPVLVRPAGLGTESDFGSFHDDRPSFRPGQIRFLLIRLSATLEDIASRVYSAARGSA